MAYNNDPRNPDTRTNEARIPGADPTGTRSTGTHSDRTGMHSDRTGGTKASSSRMAYIIGGLVLAAIVLFLIFGGMFGNNQPGMSAPAPAGGQIDGTGTGTQGTGTQGTGTQGTGTQGTGTQGTGTQGTQGATGTTGGAAPVQSN